jgi:hypothetical protein
MARIYGLSDPVSPSPFSTYPNPLSMQTPNKATRSGIEKLMKAAYRCSTHLSQSSLSPSPLPLDLRLLLLAPCAPRGLASLLITSTFAPSCSGNNCSSIRSKRAGGPGRARFRGKRSPRKRSRGFDEGDKRPRYYSGLPFGLRR